MPSKGYAKTHRKLLDSEIWQLRPGERRTRAEAWVELILKAAHRDRSVKYRGKQFHLVRGQLAASVRDMAKRWNWGIASVDRFLTWCRSRGMITTENRAGITVITILNYEEYQGNPPERRAERAAERKPEHHAPTAPSTYDDTRNGERNGERNGQRNDEQELLTRINNKNTPGGEQAKPADPPSEYVFPVRSGEWTLPQSKLDEYLEAYPLMDVHQELRQLRQWCRDNPGKRKTANGMKAFLTKNLNRHHNTGRYARRSDAGGNGATTSKPSDIFKDL